MVVKVRADILVLLESWVTREETVDADPSRLMTPVVEVVEVPEATRESKAATVEEVNSADVKDASGSKGTDRMATASRFEEDSVVMVGAIVVWLERKIYYDILTTN